MQNYLLVYSISDELFVIVKKVVQQDYKSILVDCYAIAKFQLFLTLDFVAGLNKFVDKAIFLTDHFLSLECTDETHNELNNLISDLAMLPVHEHLNFIDHVSFGNTLI